MKSPARYLLAVDCSIYSCQSKRPSEDFRRPFYPQLKSDYLNL
ncbi:hypothetical protein NEIFL0001_0304 [Neisseria flavescens SK114]|nr:hypothetical protein NEIFL0001_0304 [Neisseria flavescens SK114]